MLSQFTANSVVILCQFCVNSVVNSVVNAFKHNIVVFTGTPGPLGIVYTRCNVAVANSVVNAFKHNIVGSGTPGPPGIVYTRCNIAVVNAVVNAFKHNIVGSGTPGPLVLFIPGVILLSSMLPSMLSNIILLVLGTPGIVYTRCNIAVVNTVVNAFKHNIA